jgi:hypothetical protein
MKRKCLLILTILALALILSGCAGGIVTPDTNEAKIRSIINEYFSALNDQNWSKAKSYCIYGEDLYYDVIQCENTVNTYSYCNIVNVNIVVDIVDVNMALIGDPSEYCVQCVMVDISTACGNYINNDPAILIYLHLEKVGDSWKLSYKHT